MGFSFGGDEGNRTPFLFTLKIKDYTFIQLILN